MDITVPQKPDKIATSSPNESKILKEYYCKESSLSCVFKYSGNKCRLIEAAASALCLNGEWKTAE